MSYPFIYLGWNAKIYYRMNYLYLYGLEWHRGKKFALVLIYGSKFQDHVKKICRGDGTLTEHVM